MLAIDDNFGRMIMYPPEKITIYASVKENECNNTYAKLKRFISLVFDLTKDVRYTYKTAVIGLSMKIKICDPNHHSMKSSIRLKYQSARP